MTRWISATVLVAAAILVGAAVALGVGGSPVVSTASGGAAAAESDRDSRQDPEERAARPSGHGPPSWARDGEPGPPPWARAGKAEPSKGWQAAWRSMTPQQRERMMTRLAEEHAAGMRAFGRCLADGGDNCAKPLPPGLAKKAELGR